MSKTWGKKKEPAKTTRTIPVRAREREREKYMNIPLWLLLEDMSLLFKATNEVEEEEEMKWASEASVFFWMKQSFNYDPQPPLHFLNVINKRNISFMQKN